MLVLLSAWEIIKERNARVFRNVASMPSLMISTIKSNAKLWGMVGKNLNPLMPQE
jgi:hypothetical protein